jgi:hypothetical protein
MFSRNKSFSGRKSLIVEFYENQIEFRGNSETRKIDYIHKHWSGDYHKLEMYHGYIQWIFPNMERSMFNIWAPVINDEECEVFKKSQKISERLVKSSIMMLDFWGFELAGERKEGAILLKRCANWKTQLRNLCGHNLLRVTRMLKCWGLVGMESWQSPFILRILFEIFIMGELQDSLYSLERFWITSVIDKNEKNALLEHFKILISATKNVEEFAKLADYAAFQAFRVNTPEFESIFNKNLKIIESKTRRVVQQVQQVIESEDLESKMDESKEIIEASSMEVLTENKVGGAPQTDSENIENEDSKISLD